MTRHLRAVPATNDMIRRFANNLDVVFVTNPEYAAVRAIVRQIGEKRGCPLKLEPVTAGTKVRI